MTGGVRMPRRRGGLSGLILVLLGTWGGIAPYIGPSFGYGFTPDKAWASTPGRLYLSAVPGVVVLLTGLIVLITRSRWFGGLCAMIAALSGGWFIVGAGVISLLPASLGASSISPGAPIGTTPASVVLAQLGMFAGVGALIVFFSALAFGRFSIAAHKDHLRAAELAGVAGLPGLADAGALALSSYGSGLEQTGPYPPTQSLYPPQYPLDPYQPTQDPFGATAEQYPTTPDPFATTQEQYQDPYGATRTSYPEERLPPAQV